MLAKIFMILVGLTITCGHNDIQWKKRTGLSWSVFDSMKCMTEALQQSPPYFLARVESQDCPKTSFGKGIGISTVGLNFEDLPLILE